MPAGYGNQAAACRRCAAAGVRRLGERIDDSRAGRTADVKERAGRVAPASGRVRREIAMTNLAGWISPEVLRALGWTLLHFVWQGAGLAALFAVAMAICRSAQTRYALAVASLGLMVASP